MLSPRHNDQNDNIYTVVECVTMVLHFSPQIPFQDNSSDCGIFVLQFVESLLETAHQGNPLPSTSDEWASYEQTRAKRKELDKLIRNLQEKCG